MLQPEPGAVGQGEVVQHAGRAAGRDGAAPRLAGTASRHRRRCTERRGHSHHARDARQLLEPGRRGRPLQLEVQRPLGCRHVLRQLDARHPLEPARTQDLANLGQYPVRVGQELARGGRVAQVVGALAKEADSRSAEMKPRPHPVAALRRRMHRDRRRTRDVANPGQRVENDLGLEGELAGIGDVGVDIAAAGPVGAGRPAIRAGRDHLDGDGVGDAGAGALDQRAHLFAGNGGADEDDESVVAGEHPAPGRRLFDLQRDDCPCPEQRAPGARPHFSPRSRQGDRNLPPYARRAVAPERGLAPFLVPVSISDDGKPAAIAQQRPDSGVTRPRVIGRRHPRAEVSQICLSLRRGRRQQLLPRGGMHRL